MTITEHLMRPGTGNLRFRSGVPADVTERIRQLVDENSGSGAVGAHVVILPEQIDDVDSLTDSTLLGFARYTGAIVGRPSRLSLELVGIASWLDTYIDAAITNTTGTPATWLSDLLVNGITSGTVTTTGLSNVTRTFPAYAQTHRQALDVWAGLAGAEYRVLPDFTVDVATAANLFRQVSDPGAVVVTRRREGSDGLLTGIDGGLVDQRLSRLGTQLATKAVALGLGAGDAIATGSDTQTLNLKNPSGGSPDLVRVFSSPAEESANVAAAATGFLNLQGMRRQVTITSQTHDVAGLVVPGDEVYVFDPVSGLFDMTNPVEYRGETIFPIVVRLLSYNWPIENGLGVYVRSNAATPEWIDVTGYVEWETGDAWWTIGDWNPPGYGPANRTAPEIEERVAAPVDSGTYTPTLANMAIGTGGGAKNTAEYVYANGMLSVWGEIVFGTSGATLPAGSTETIAFPSGFTSDLPGNGIPIGTVRMTVAGDDYMGPLVGGSGATATLRYLHRRPANDFIDTLPPTATTPATWAAGDIIAYQFSVPASRT